jgi:NAD(P)-dependent dehydrogenase (short-subunit alcohol dehydrogenase family)
MSQARAQIVAATDAQAVDRGELRPPELQRAMSGGCLRRMAVAPHGALGSEIITGDIAHALSFLASEGAGFITGQRILVDGGRHLGS